MHYGLSYAETAWLLFGDARMVRRVDRLRQSVRGAPEDSEQLLSASFACEHWTEAICQAPILRQAKPGGQREYQATDEINAYAEEHGALVTDRRPSTMSCAIPPEAAAVRERFLDSQAGQPGVPVRTEASPDSYQVSAHRLLR